MTQPPAIKGINIRHIGDAQKYLTVFDGTLSGIKLELDRFGKICTLQKEKSSASAWPKNFVTGGLIDIQVNGFAGIDFNSGGLTSQKMDHALAHMAASGVSCVLPTLITATEPDLISLLETLDNAVSNSILGPLMVAGYHIEGPFLSPEEGNAGAHPAAAMIPASTDLVKKLMDVSTRPITIITLAPEQEGVLELIPFLVERGVVCAIGHTGASRVQIDMAIGAGATLSTHLGNGLPHMLNKNQNPLFSQLGRDELSASFIADGIHIHPESLKTYLRAKTLARSIITTDAVSAAGKSVKAGIYKLGATQVERHRDGSVRIPGSTYLAGSSASMDQMVRNLMHWYGFTMGEILQLAQENPARIVGDFIAPPKVGSMANFVHWQTREGALQVKETIIGPWVISSAT